MQVQNLVLVEDNLLRDLLLTKRLKILLQTLPTQHYNAQNTKAVLNSRQLNYRTTT